MKILVLLLVLPILAVTARAQGTIRATTTLHPDGSKSTTIVDPEKMTAEETLTDSAGKTVRRVTYLLDEQSQPIASIAYDPKGTILYRSSYKRDTAGRIEEENITSPDGHPLRRRVYTYGTGTKVTNMVEYDASGNVIAPARPTAARPDKKKH